MKKFITILCVLLMAATYATAQVPFIHEGNYSYMKILSDKLGIGTTTPGEKVTIVSQSGEAILGLKGYSTQNNPVIKVMNSQGTAIWNVYAKNDWWTMGNSIDTTTALFCGKQAKGWLRLNGTLYVVGNVTATGTISQLTGAATATTLTVSGASQTGDITSGKNGSDGKLTIYSEQGGTDYSVSLNPNSTMTSAANFYLPADEPGATYPVTCTSGGVMGYNDQAVATASTPTFAGLTIGGTTYSNGRIIRNVAVPKPFDSTGTLVAADVLRGVITCTSGAATSITLPTATTIATLITGCGRGTWFDLIIDNSAGSNTITVVADASMPVITPAITGGAALTITTANAVGMFRFYFTSGTTGKLLRIF